MTEKEVIRIQRWRLAIICHAQEVSHNVAKTCRYYGIAGKPTTTGTEGILNLARMA